jgi:hypothetical protein
MTHKRLIAFCITATLLTFGLFWAGDNYGAYSAALGAAFSVYATGQSWTDVRKAQAGQT